MSRHERAVDRLGRLPSTVLSRSQSAVEAAGFWGAVLAPLGYLPALALNQPLELLVALVMFNVACLIAGHRHRPSLDAGLLARLARAGRPGGER